MANTGYLTTVPGILKLAGIGVSLLAFICAIIPYWSTHLGAGWNQFAAMFTFIVLILLLCIHLVDYHGRIPNFPLLNLIIYAVLVLFNFIAFIIGCVISSRYSYLGSHFNYPAVVTSVIFFVILIAILIFSMFLAFRDFRAGTSTETTVTSKTTTVTTTVTA